MADEFAGIQVCTCAMSKQIVCIFVKPFLFQVAAYAAFVFHLRTLAF
jgi:hypothetical protein